MHIRYVRVTALILLTASLLVSAVSSAKDKPNDKAEPFSGAVTERLMNQVRDGLKTGNADTVLAAFDRDNTPGYDEFAAQLHAFLGRWENIRIYYQIIQSTEKPCATACGVGIVQFQMEGNDVQSLLPAMRRSTQLELTFQRTDKGWRITNITPRDIFQ